MKKYRVGIIGATGMVGQRFLTILEKHPWFEVSLLSTSKKNEGKTYFEALNGRWVMNEEIPNAMKNMIVSNAESISANVSKVDFVFCAINLERNKTKELEEKYALAECPVISNNSAHRNVPDVPMIIPEINSQHCNIIKHQRNRLKTKLGFIATKPNCSIQSYVPPLDPLRKFGLKKVYVCTYQAVSGAGKTLETWPEMQKNLIPYIKGEEEKSEKEPLKIWGKIINSEIKNANSPSITAQCIRVPVLNGHMAAVFVEFENTISLEEIKHEWKNFSTKINKNLLPSSPKNFLNYFEENDRPQNKLDVNLDNGMAISIGRLRSDKPQNYKFVCLSHNTLRGAAGGAVLMAEFLAKNGYLN
ncbi:MAG: aspartate-semialdehyde dehydrogenase [Clostridiales bacterium]|jgi:aspartate-semialdehyde dehydrogenase|nr:aspartate-semialdehyde dehydrogenase [Clostridiales bacterium]